MYIKRASKKQVKARAEANRYGNGDERLLGFVKVDGQTIVIEDLRHISPEWDPQYQAILPEGYHLSGYGNHIVLAETQKRLLERLENGLTKCTKGCGCGCKIDKGD